MSRTHLDLCSGIGGFALSAAWAGYTTIGFVEIDPWCRRVLAKHWPETPQHDDIKTLTGDVVRAWLGRAEGIADVADPESRRAFGPSESDQDARLGLASGSRGQRGEGRSGRLALDLITGGYPCQPFSLAGKRLGAADDRHLWPFIAALVADLQPRRCLFENVGGHVSMGLDDVLADLESLGYACGAVVVPAAAVGAPHRRDRVWILADAERGRGREQLRVDAAQGALPPSERTQSPSGTRSGGETLAHAASERERKPTDQANALAIGGHAWTEPRGGGWNGQALSGLGLQTDGLPGFLARLGGLDALETHDPRQVSTSFPGHPTVRGVRLDVPSSAPSPGLQRSVAGGVPMPTVSCQSGPAGRHAEEATGEGLPDLRQDVQQLHPRSEQDVLAGIPLGDGPAERNEAMGQGWRVGPGILNPWAGDWEAGCPRTQEHEPDRVNKLKALGNAIVPQVAYALLSIWDESEAA